MTTSEILNDPLFPKINKEIAVNDFVVNKILFDDIVPCSVGVVKSINNELSSIYFIGKGKQVQMENNNLIVIDIYKTGKPTETDKPPYKYKICNICHQIKCQSTDFEYNQNDKYGRQTTRPSCKNCRVSINGRNMPTSEKRRMEAIKPQDYELFECPICHKRSIPGVTCNIVIDHDHRTGKARAWICDSCNTGIGRFQDDPEMIKKIATYIQNFLEQ
ncbi:MAG: endonuclease VII domain-containing protein [Paludibacteraceae bacterium]|nr:endonuclease VII domain-containing protein [Paludibacteraceae bacterium]